ncbi:MAG TPA: SBBP repeat-containing protein [Kofleriaceae bacterium]|nr:SBBP repeat-containing protein [Kofleriaceae bacterium]
MRWLAVLVLVAGCLRSELVPCGERACPAGDVCVAGDRCAAPADVEACTGLADGAACASPRGSGVCAGGACAVATCGNSERDPSEACDDGNLVSGDGCRADCAKVEECGDAVLDEGEVCDDGNDNAIDGCDACQRQRWTASTSVGSVRLATAAALDEPSGVAVDRFGNVYVAEPDTARVRKIEPGGSISTIAGTGVFGFAGDGGQAASALLRTPTDVAVDALGNIYIADGGNRRIRVVSADGMIQTIAGTGAAGETGDGGPATAATFLFPRSIAVDGLGNVYVADGNAVRRIRIDGVIERFAGTGVAGFAGDGMAATGAMLRSVRGLAIDDQGRIVIADSGNDRVRRVSATGVISTIAGGGTGGDEGPALAAALGQPLGVAVAPSGELYISQFSIVRVVTTDGIIHRFAGTSPGFGGDGGPAVNAKLAATEDIDVGVDGAVVVADSDNNRVRRIANATISTIAGIGNEGLIGDGGDATAAQYGYPQGIHVDDAGALYIADSDFSRVRRVAPIGDVSTLAGTGEYGTGGDGGPAVAARLMAPYDVTSDPAGNVYVADRVASSIRRIATDGTITTIAGTGVPGFSGDGGPATAAQLLDPDGLAFTSAGELLIADRGNHRIRRIDAQGNIHTFAGDGTAGATGDGGPATAASLNRPVKLAVRGTEVWIADAGNLRIRRVDATGTISTFAGGGTATGDGGLAVDAALATVQSVAVDAEGIVYVGQDDRVQRIALDGTIWTVIARSSLSSDGDGGPAAQATLFGVNDLACDAAGALYILDTTERRVRRVSPLGTITTVAGFIGPEFVGPATTARLATPAALAYAGGRIFVATGVQGVVEMVADGRVRRAIGRYPHWPATGALANFQDGDFGAVGGVAVDETTGTIYLTERSAHRIHAVTTTGPGIDPAVPETWTIATLANASGTAGAGDGALATARFREPAGLLFDPGSRTLLVADTGNHAIRAIDLTAGQVSTVVNASHSLGYAGDGGAAAEALLYQPSALARCPNGDLFIADTGNHRIRRVATSATTSVTAATITTVLGDGVRASSGEGAPARVFPVAAPLGLACDAENNVFVSSTTTVRALPANAAGVIDGEGPVVTIYGAGPQTEFPGSQTTCLTGVISRSESGHSAHIQVADACSGLLVDLARGPAP